MKATELIDQTIERIRTHGRGTDPLTGNCEYRTAPRYEEDGNISDTCAMCAVGTWIDWLRFDAQSFAGDVPHWISSNNTIQAAFNTDEPDGEECGMTIGDHPVEELDSWLTETVRGFPARLWNDLQTLHDGSHNWNEDGRTLSERGEHAAAELRKQWHDCESDPQSEAPTSNPV